MKKLLLIYLVLISVVLISSCRKYKDVKKNTIYSEFELQGVDRSYLVHLPATYDSTKTYPLIFVLHGIASRAKAIAGFSNFNEAADEKEFIVVYPQGYKKSWGIELKIGPAPRKGINDFAFFDHLIDTLVSDYSVDQDKIYTCGISNGGFMSVALACNLSERFSGVALVCSNMFEPVSKWYRGGKPMPILFIGGGKDPLLAYEGGELLMKNNYSSIGFEAAIEYWVDKNQCSYPTDSLIIDNDPKDKTSVVKYYYADETEKNNVILYKINGGGHAWPGRGKDFKSNFFGDITSEINAAEVISDFFLNR